jgi:hypothetical protein
MPFIEIKRGGSDVEIPDGVYAVTLVDISDPRTVTAQRGPNAGQDVTLIDWTFALDNGDTVDASTSTASGPRSKMYAFLTALFGGKAPPVGTQLEKDHLIGRQALATIQTDEGGWPRIMNLGAVPNTMPLPQAVAPAQPAAAAPRPPATPTNTQAVVPQQRAPRRNAPAVEAPRFNAEGQIPVGTAAAAADDDLPF